MARAYRLGQRAAARTDRRQRVLEATGEVLWEQGFDATTLQAVADRAGLSLKSLVRYFGTKDALLRACMKQAVRDEEAQRDVPVGDVDAIARTLADRYEKVGDWHVRNSHVEFRHPLLAEWMAAARRSHRDWLARAFAPWLDVGEPLREQRVMALFCATELRSWWAVRHAFGHDVKTATAVMKGILEALVASFRRPRRSKS